MKLAGRITVEPLDEERLTKIERRIVAGAVDAADRAHDVRAPRRHLGPALAAAALAAAATEPRSPLASRRRSCTTTRRRAAATEPR